MLVRFKVRMWRHGCNPQEEGPFPCNRILQEPKRLFSKNVRRMPAFIADRGIVVPLIGGVQVRVGIGIEEEIGSIEPGHVGRVVVVDSVRIEELACVVCVVPGLLQPDGEEVGVESLLNEFWIASCSG